jgi:hypothetical protein
MDTAQTDLALHDGNIPCTSSRLLPLSSKRVLVDRVPFSLEDSRLQSPLTVSSLPTPIEDAIAFHLITVVSLTHSAYSEGLPLAGPMRSLSLAPYEHCCRRVN